MVLQEEIKEIFDDEYGQFLHHIRQSEGALVYARYVEKNEYKEDYSEQSIKKAQERFAQKSKEYLQNVYPGRIENKYIKVDRRKNEEKNKNNRIGTFCNTFDGSFYRMFL